MRIDIKKVRGHEYLQFTDVHGHVYHIGSAVDVESWKKAYWLFGLGLDDLQFEFVMKMRAQLAKRLDWTEELEQTLESYLGRGKQGYLGSGAFADSMKKIDDKAVACMQLRKAIQRKFPDIRRKEELRRTVDYNRRRQKVEVT